MKIIELSIPDIKKESIDSSKIALANKIVYNILPIIQPQISKQIKDLKSLNESIKVKKKKITSEKSILKDLQKAHQKKKRINLLLNRVEQLVNLGLDDSLRAEMINMLRKVNDLSDDKIDFYLAETLRIITRRFSKIEKE